MKIANQQLKQLRHIIKEEIHAALQEQRGGGTVFEAEQGAKLTRSVVRQLPYAAPTTAAALGQLAQVAPVAAETLLTSVGAASAGAIAGAALAGAAIGVGIGLTINYGIDWAKDAARHRRMYTAGAITQANNVKRLVKQAKAKGINGKETEELVHSWIGLAGKNKNLAKGYVKFIKFLKEGPWGKHFPAYIEISSYLR